MRFALAASIVLLAASCSSTASMTPAEKREFIAEVEAATLAELVERRPEAGALLEESVGHAVFDNRVTKIPMVGWGGGFGVVVRKSTGERTYLKVGRLDVGSGLGIRSYRLVFVFSDEKALDRMAEGRTGIEAGAEAGAGEGELGTAVGSSGEGYELYQLAKQGVSATLTLRAIRYSVVDLDE